MFTNLLKNKNSSKDNINEYKSKLIDDIYKDIDDNKDDDNNKDDNDIKMNNIDNEINDIINTIEDNFKLYQMEDDICNETNNILDILKTDITEKTIQNSNINNNVKYIIYKIKNNSCFYLDNRKIYDEILESIKIIIKNNSIKMKNKCPDCGIDMGINTNRKLCGKTRCYNLGQKKLE